MRSTLHKYFLGYRFIQSVLFVFIFEVTYFYGVNLSSINLHK